MPHGFPKDFSPIPAHVEHDVTFDVHSHRIEWDNPFWDRKVTLHHCGCEVTLPKKAVFYGVTATWHFIFADIEHKDCPVKRGNAGFATIIPEAFMPTKEEIGRIFWLKIQFDVCTFTLQCNYYGETLFKLSTN